MVRIAEENWKIFGENRGYTFTKVMSEMLCTDLVALADSYVGEKQRCSASLEGWTWLTEMDGEGNNVVGIHG